MILGRFKVKQLTKKETRPVLLMMLGIMFLVIRVFVNVGVFYPTYEMETAWNEPGWEFQYNTLDQFYGVGYTFAGYTSQGLMTVSDLHWEGYPLDVFNDLIGYGLLIAAFLMLAKNWVANKEYIREDHMTGKVKTAQAVCPEKECYKGICAAAAGIVVRILLFVLPFFLEGISLCYGTMAIGFVSFILLTLSIYFAVNGTCSRLWEISYRRDRVYMFSFYLVILVFEVIHAISVWSHVTSINVAYTVFEWIALIFLLSRFYMRMDAIVRGQDPEV